MNRNIVVVTENEKCIQELKKVGKELHINIKGEVQAGNNIIDELSVKDIQESIAVLFCVNNPVEEIAKIERFIDFEYYEVEPKFIIDDAKAVLKEILNELN